MEKGKFSRRNEMKGKGKWIAAGLLLCVAAIGGTLAYFNQTMTLTNEFDTGTYDTELVEEFKPSEGQNWEPGTEVNKDVTVKNAGTLPVVVRVKFKETWERDGNAFYSYDTVEDRVNKDMADSSPTGQNKFENVYQTHPETKTDEPDGEAGTGADDSVVYKVLILGDPATDSPCWVYNSNDGYYYYTGVLAGSVENANGTTTYAETSKLLDSVTLSENVDMGYYDEIRYYATASDATSSNADDWAEFEKDGGEYVSTSVMNSLVAKLWAGSEITFMRSEAKVDPDRMGYSDAEYTLTITAQTVQATKNAVETAFGSAVLDYWGSDLMSDDNH